MKVQVAWIDGGPAVDYDFPAGVDNATHIYNVRYTASTGSWSFLRDGVTKLSLSTMAWVPTVAQISGEISNQRTQMMGTVGLKQRFSANQIRINSVWSTYAGTHNANWTGSGDSGNATDFYVWDLCP